MKTIKVLSIQQPYASAYAIGPKKYENRHWWTSHTGPLLIQAAKSHDRMIDLAHVKTLWPEAPDKYDFGMAIGVVEVLGCPDIEYLTRASPILDPWVDGPYCIERSERRARLTPFPLRGQPGMFSLPLDQVPEPARSELQAFLATLTKTKGSNAASSAHSPTPTDTPAPTSSR